MLDALGRELWSFTGRRIGRRAWWAVLIGVVLLGHWGFGLIQREVSAPFAWHAKLIMMWLLGAALVYASWLRFQDRDRPGWLALAWPLAGAADGLLARFQGPGPSSLPGGLVMIGVLAWLILELGLMAGTDGRNRYGPSPDAMAGQRKAVSPGVDRRPGRALPRRMQPHRDLPMSLDAADPVALTRALVRCPSITRRRAARSRCWAASWPPPALWSKGRSSASLATLMSRTSTPASAKAAPRLSLPATHRCRPPGDAARWSHGPFDADVADGFVFGRGAVDMKGGVAASVAAVLRYLNEQGGKPPRGSIAFLITGDEESHAVNGTVKLLAWALARGERFDHCILGEPTNPTMLGEMIKIGRRGSLTGRLTVEGRQGHVGYPHLADNPIRGMIRLAGALLAEPLDEGTAHFDPSNLEFTTIDVGNVATNVIPAQARATFNIRFNDRWTPKTLEDEIRWRCEAAAGNVVRYTLAFEPTNAVAFLTQPGPFVERFADAVEAETGRRPGFSTSGGTSDARFIKDACPVIEFGLVGQTMHQVDERVSVADLESLTRIYRRVLEGYFA
jgi:succinyl-diaminopimelate desuccinylase